MGNVGVICCGADGQAKSTLAKELGIRLGERVIHYDPPRPGTTDFFEEYTRHLDRGDRPVFDRNYLSETVYGPLFRGVSGVTLEIQKRIEREYARRGYCLVLCDSDDYCKYIKPGRKEMYDAEGIERARQGFKAAFATVELPKLIVNAFDQDQALTAIFGMLAHILRAG